MIADFAVLLLGGVTVSVYATLTDEQTAYILRDASARVVFVSSEKQLQEVLAVIDQVPVERVVVMDAVETTRAFSMERLMHEGPQQFDPQFDAAAREIRLEDLATIIYTSGTTGTPKGAMLTHGNVASNISCSRSDFGVMTGATSISFLPLSYVTARHVDFAT